MSDAQSGEASESSTLARGVICSGTIVIRLERRDLVTHVVIGIPRIIVARPIIAIALVRVGIRV